MSLLSFCFLAKSLAISFGVSGVDPSAIYAFLSSLASILTA